MAFGYTKLILSVLCCFACLIVDSNDLFSLHLMDSTALLFLYF
jgi:hypothetical protein